MIKNYRMYSWTIFEVFSIRAILQQIFGSRAFVPLENCIVFFYGCYLDKCDCQKGKRFTVGVPSMRISDAPSLRCVASQDFFKITVVRGLIITETYASILYKVDHFETPKISQGLVFLFYVAQIVR